MLGSVARFPGPDSALPSKAFPVFCDGMMLTVMT